MSGDQNSAETLMNVLISKMESMDSDIHMLKAENMRLKQLVSDPSSLMRKMGLVSTMTPLARDVMEDGFRPTEGDAILKGPDEIGLPTSNAEFHNTSWDDIHAMADEAKAAGNVEEPFKIITGRDVE